MTTRTQVVVVGGGIAGLSAALALQDEGVSFRLLEASDDWGGVVRTYREGGFLLDPGPDSLLAAKPEAIRLCERLNLTSRLIPTNPTDRRIYFLEAGRLHPLPDGMFLTIPTRIGPFLKSPLFSWPGKLRMGLDLFLRRRPPGPDESISRFVARHFGREAVEKLGEPLLAGIHAGDPDLLSIQATFPRFVDLERRYGSLIRGTWMGARRQERTPRSAPFVSLLGGLGELVEGVVGAISGENRSLGCRVRALNQSQGWHRVEIAGGATIEARSVILAIPAPRSAEILETADPGTASRLRELVFVSSATVFLGFRRESVGHPLDGYGLMVPRTAGLRTSACTFVSTKLAGRAPEGKVLLRGFFGGARDPEVAQMSDHDLVRTMREEMGPLLGFDGEPELSRVFRWPSATPQLAVGHGRWIDGIGSTLAPGIILAGAGYRVTGIPDSIGDGQRAARQAIHSIQASTEPASKVVP
jgi:oxygen-dependent protoporphyrinogen oxidase